MRYFEDFGVVLDVGLEASIEDVLGDLVDLRAGELLIELLLLDLSHLLLDGPVQPSVHVWHPPDIGLIDKQYSGSGHGGRGRVPKIGDLK